MTQREKNRIKEHQPHGWRPTEPIVRGKKKAGDILMACPCGWLGWISEKALEKAP